MKFVAGTEFASRALRSRILRSKSSERVSVAGGILLDRCPPGPTAVPSP
jgi:hypothetical protein